MRRPSIIAARFEIETRVLSSTAGHAEKRAPTLDPCEQHDKNLFIWNANTVLICQVRTDTMTIDNFGDILILHKAFGRTVFTSYC